MTKRELKPTSSWRRVLKHIRNITISVGVLLVLLVGAGALYTWYMGGQQVAPEAPVVETSKELTPVVAPRTVAPDAKVSLSTQSVTSPVRPGDNASITARTNPKAGCTITVTYGELGEKDKQSDDSGLYAKTADEYGMVSWTWTVESNRPQGVWPIEVTCANEANSAYLKAELVVKTS